MTVALWIFSILISFASIMSGLGKFTKMEQTVQTLKSVGVKDSQIPVLGALEVAGALGLFVGIWVPLLGQLAAIGLTVYFAGAVVAHSRVGHVFKQILPATILLLVALLTAIFQLSR